MNRYKQNILKFLHSIFIFAVLLTVAYVTIFGASIINGSIMLLLFLFFYKVTLQQLKKNSISPPPASSYPDVCNHTNSGYGAFILTIILSFFCISWLLYYSWLNGDDFGWLIFGNNSLFEKIRIIGGSHLHWVSRHGDTVATAIGVSLNHWQVWILSSAVIAMAPLAYCRLLKKNPKQTFCTNYIILYLFILSIMLSPNSPGWWQDYTCFVASTTYVWTPVATVLFLSHYNKYNQNQQSRIKTVWIFLLGLYSGWGTECLTVIILPLLAIYCFYKHVKKIYIPLNCYLGLLGYILGAIFLFVSPAHSYRAKVASSFRAIIPENLTYDQILDFCTNLTYEKICMLGGEKIILQGIPYHLHIYFVPRMAEIFWEESKVATIILIILFIIASLNKSINKKRLSLITFTSFVMAWLSASSYLAQCIPTSSAFVPPVFFLIGACGYIFFELSRKQKITLCLLSLCYMLWNIVPAGIEAHKYKKYELSWYEEIQTQKDNGVQNIILSPIPEKPINRLHLIKRSHLTTNPQDGANKCLAQHFGVNSIRIQSDYKEQKQD